jgi:hypothetical protein
MRAIYGRHVAKRMAIVGAIVFTSGLILAAVFSDPEFIFFGFIGTLGTAISSAVAIAGERTRPALGASGRSNGPSGRDH